MSTVPVFAPTGELGDIPAGKLNDAVKAGFQPGVHVQSADGQNGVIPAHRTADAIKAGMKLIPIQDQPIQHEGFWSALGNDLKGMVAGAAQIPQMMSAGPAGFLPTAANMGINDMQRAMEGRSTPYRAIAPVGEMAGVNVRGMEESANQGDVGGVMGHAAAVPTAMAAGEILGRAPLGRIAKAGGAAIKGGAEKVPIVGPVAKGAIRGGLKSWRASAPDVEIPASKVSTTPPESVSKSSQLQQARALQNVPVQAQAGSSLPPQVQAAPSNFPTAASRAASDAAFTSRYPNEQFGGDMPPNLQTLWQQSAGFEKPVEDIGTKIEAARPAIPRSSSKSAILSRLQQNAQQSGAEVSAPETYGRDLRIAGQPVAADTNLAPALQKSLPANARLQGKIMQAVRKEGPGSTVEIDRLMQAPGLQGYSREQVLDAARSLRDKGKIWHDGETVALKKR